MRSVKQHTRRSLLQLAEGHLTKLLCETPSFSSPPPILHPHPPCVSLHSPGRQTNRERRKKKSTETLTFYRARTTRRLRSSLKLWLCSRLFVFPRRAPKIPQRRINPHYSSCSVKRKQPSLFFGDRTAPRACNYIYSPASG